MKETWFCHWGFQPTMQDWPKEERTVRLWKSSPPKDAETPKAAMTSSSHLTQGSLLPWLSMTEVHPTGAGFLTLLLGCRPMPGTISTLFILMHLIALVKAENKTISRQHLKHWKCSNVVGVIQISSTLTFCSIFLTLSILCFTHHILSLQNLINVF